MAAGATFLYMMLWLHGTATPGPVDFSFAFAAVAMLSVLAVPFFLRMPADAGAEISGRSVPGKAAGE